MRLVHRLARSHAHVSVIPLSRCRRDSQSHETKQRKGQQTILVPWEGLATINNSMLELFRIVQLMRAHAEDRSYG